MPIRPQGQMRPADVIGNAVLVAKIVTVESVETGYKQPAEAKTGQAQAKVRAKYVTAQERSNVAKKAAAARRD